MFDLFHNHTFFAQGLTPMYIVNFYDEIELF